MSCTLTPRRWLAAALALASAGPLLAQDDGTTVAVQWQAVAYRSTEWRDDGAVFNAERGWLRGARLSLGWALDQPSARAPGQPQGAAAGRWRLSLQADEVAGDPAYRGQTQIGLPLATTTGLTRQAVQLQLAWHLPATGWPAGSGAVVPSGWVGGGLQGLRQAREIRATVFSSALTERLHSARIHLAAGVGLALPGGRWPAGLALAGQIGRPWHQALWVDGHGSFDPVRLQPARTLHREASAELWLQPAAGWQLALGWQRVWEQPGASTAQVVWRGAMPVGAVRYPGSHQVLTHWGVTLRQLH